MRVRAYRPARALTVEEVHVPPPRVLVEVWRPLTFYADGRVDLGPPRVGPAPSNVLFPPVSVRLTDDQLDGLYLALFP